LAGKKSAFQGKCNTIIKFRQHWIKDYVKNRHENLLKMDEGARETKGKVGAGVNIGAGVEAGVGVTKKEEPRKEKSMLIRQTTRKVSRLCAN